MRHWLRVLSCALLCGSHAAARAAHPLLTEDTGTQGKGNSQLELTLDAFRDRLAGVDIRGAQAAALYSYGVADPVDFQVGLPYLRVKENEGDRRTRNNFV